MVHIRDPWKDTTERVPDCQKKTTFAELTQWSTKLFDYEPVLHDGLHGLHYVDHLRGETIELQ